MGGELLTQKDIAALFQVHRHTIRNWVAAGYFPKPIESRCRKRLRWPRAVVEKWRSQNFNQSAMSKNVEKKRAVEISSVK